MIRAAVVAMSVFAMALFFSMELKQAALLGAVSAVMAWVLERTRVG